MNARFQNKVVLVTGGNSGIGLATAKAFLAEGAKVIITGRNQESLTKASQELGPNCVAIKANISKLAELDALFSQIQQVFGHLDSVFVNAGLGEVMPIAAVTEQIFDNMVNVNIKGSYFTMQKAIPLMKSGGTMVLNASIAASYGPIGLSVYAATKAAIRSMAQTFSAELLKNGNNIRVNVVSPGSIETPIWDRIPGWEANSEAFKLHNEKVLARPMKRYGKPEEVANTVLFLASSESSFIAGSEICVDGGVINLGGL